MVKHFPTKLFPIVVNLKKFMNDLFLINKSKTNILLINSLMQGGGRPLRVKQKKKNYLL